MGLLGIGNKKKDPAGRDTGIETTTRIYKDAKALEKGVNQMARDGWTLVSTTPIQTLLFDNKPAVSYTPHRQQTLVTFTRPRQHQ